MKLRSFGLPLFSYIFVVVIIAATGFGMTVVRTGTATNVEDDHAADHEAIRPEDSGYSQSPLRGEDPVTAMR